MKFCRFCGSPVEEDSIFCESCGKKLIDESDNFDYSKIPAPNLEFLESLKRQKAIENNKNINLDKNEETVSNNETSVKDLNASSHVNLEKDTPIIDEILEEENIVPLVEAKDDVEVQLDEELETKEDLNGEISSDEEPLETPLVETPITSETISENLGNTEETLEKDSVETEVTLDEDLVETEVTLSEPLNEPKEDSTTTEISETNTEDINEAEIENTASESDLENSKIVDLTKEEKVEEIHEETVDPTKESVVEEAKPIIIPTMDEMIAEVMNDRDVPSYEESPKFVERTKDPVALTGKAKKSFIALISITITLSVLFLIVGIILNFFVGHAYSILALYSAALIDIILIIITTLIYNLKIKHSCPECGSKCDHHRKYISTDSSSATKDSKGKTYKEITYIHKYEDLYVCRDCGKITSFSVRENAGTRKEYKDGTVENSSHGPREF